MGSPSNSVDPETGFGSVAYTYRVGRTEVTNGQYVDFLNAVATTDPNGLYNSRMVGTFGGILREGEDRSYSYSLKAGFENKPVNLVSYWDAVRYVNWLHNGSPGGVQNAATTEDGAYTLSSDSILSNSVKRNEDARYVIPSENEWYKAAYFDPASGTYFDYPASSDALIECALPGPTPNTANCGDVVSALTDVGSYTGSPSPAGTSDQGGNAFEWNEATFGQARGTRAGSFRHTNLAASNRGFFPATTEAVTVGFRVALVPEPGTATLFAQGIALLVAYGRRGRAGVRRM